MSENFQVMAPVRLQVQLELTPAFEMPPCPDTVTQLTPEQVHLREAVFTQQAAEHESQQVAGLLGIWSGGLLLHDLMVDSMNEPEEEERPLLGKNDEEE